MATPARAFGLSFCLLLAATANDVRAAERVTSQSSGVDVRLRGVSVVDGHVAWASGQKGTVLRTRDGGEHWQIRPVPEAQTLDFRDIEAFDADTAVILAIGPGEASRVYRTTDGGATWTRTLRNADARGFFDCMAFDGERGWLLGDPVDGRFQLYVTRNAGRRWMPVTDGPGAGEGDAAFAASGTCIARGHDTLVVATGGAHPSLRFRRDGEPAWETVPAPFGDGKPSAGVFSVAAMQQTDAFVAVGGDYKAESAPSAAITTGTLVASGHESRRNVIRPEPFGHAAHPLPAAPGYRSAIACATSADRCVAVGPSGVDLLQNGRWQALSQDGYDAVSLRNGDGWAVGNHGRIARIMLDP